MTATVTKTEVNRLPVAHTCGHADTVPVYVDEPSLHIAARLVKAANRKCPACRQVDHEAYQREEQAKCAAKKAERAARHEERNEATAQATAACKQSNAARHNLESNASVDDLPPGTIIEMVRLESGKWWGRIRRAGYAQADNESARPMGLIFRLAKDFEQALTK